jgi:excisionase family DNA binding protein
MSATDFASSLEELVESAAARAVAQVLERSEQDSGRSPWYTSVEAAEYTRLSLNAVKQARRRGQLRFDRSETGRIRFHVDDLEAFLRAKSAAA